MTLTPSLTVIPARFRGASSSADMNTSGRAAYADIVNVYAALNAQIAQTQLQNETLAMTNTSLLTQLTALWQKLTALQTSFQSLSQINIPGDQAAMSISLYDVAVSYGGVPSYPAMPASLRATYAPLFGQILPNVVTPAISKCYVADPLTGQITLPPSVATSQPSVITPTVAPFLIEESDPSTAVDGQGTTIWRRNVYFPVSQNISQVEVTLTVTLPQQFINSLTCNYVTIHPYPVMGVDITSVVLVGISGSQNVQLLPVDVSGAIQPLVAASATRLVFPDQPVTAVQVTFRSSNPILTLKPGLQAFVLGAQIVDVGWLGFNQSSSKVLVPFSLANNYFSTITGITGLPADVSAQLYYQSPSGDYVNLAVGATPLGYCRSVYVELTLTPRQGVIPVVQSLGLTFLPLYVLN